MTRFSIRYLAKLYFFWLLLFAINRIVFLVAQISELQPIAFKEIAASFYYALQLDSSTACYSLALPFIILWIAWWSRKSFWLKILKGVILIFILLHCMIAFGEAALYTQWHTKINWDALAHFAHPSEVFSTATWGLTLLFFGTTIVLGGVFIILYNRLLHPEKLPAGKSRRLWNGALVWLITGFVIFTGIRGGWRRFPISLSLAYYSPHAVLNDAAVNPAWYLINDYTERKGEEENLYHWMPDKMAKQVVDSLYDFRKDSTVSVLTTQRPNIVLFILESWPADIIQAPHVPDVMPVFDSLLQQGIYFDHCYPTGFVSDQGLPGILSAFPTSGSISILSRPEHTIHLPAMNEDLKTAGYQTGFIYGGMLDFGNIQSYIYNKKFDLVKAGRDFSSDYPRGALGIPDGAMVQPVLQLIDKAKPPFFYCWYTLSTHPPYDIPVPKWIKYGGLQQDFVNTLHYADSSLGMFFQKAKTKPWYKNTLFVFVSDHSHDSQYKRAAQHKDRNRIPLMFYGDVIRPGWRGKTIQKITSQLDIAATLLAQLGLPYKNYPWSKDAFNPYAPHFAAYNYMSGSGFITPKGFVAQDNRFPDFLLTDLKDSTEIQKLTRLNRAYAQQAYHYFLSW